MNIDDSSYEGHVGTMSYITGRELDLTARKSEHKSLLLYDGSVSCNVLIRSTTVDSQWFIQQFGGFINQNVYQSDSLQISQSGIQQRSLPAKKAVNRKQVNY